MELRIAVSTPRASSHQQASASPACLRSARDFLSSALSLGWAVMVAGASSRSLSASISATTPLKWATGSSNSLASSST